MVANPTIYFCEICSIDCDFAWHNMLQGAPRQQSGVWHSTNWTLAISFPHSGRCCWISTKNHVTALVPLESRFFRIEDSKMYFSLTHESTSSLGCSKTPLGTDNSSHQTPCPLVLMQRNGRPHTRKPWVAGREASFHRPDIYWWKPLAMKAMWVCQKIRGTPKSSGLTSCSNEIAMFEVYLSRHTHISLSFFHGMPWGSTHLPNWPSLADHEIKCTLG